MERRRRSWIFYSFLQKSQGKKTNFFCIPEELKPLIFRTKKTVLGSPEKGQDGHFRGNFKLPVFCNRATNAEAARISFKYKGIIVTAYL